MSICKFLPPNVSLVRLTSYFCGCLLQTILLQLTSFHRSFEISPLWMKNLVLLPVFWPGIPCDSLPISFPKDYPQSFLCFGRLIRWQYSISLPVSLSRLAPAKSARNWSGYDLDADCFAVRQILDTYTALNSFFCFDALVLLAGVLYSWLIIAGAPLFVVASFDG